MRLKIAAIGATCAMAIGVGASSASAQGPIFTGGLVNVTLVDVLDVNNNNVNVQVPIGVAVNVCNVGVAAIVENNEQTGAACRAESTQLPVAFQPQP